MTFCGQCGLQLASSQTQCPRCGTLVEPDMHMTAPPMDAYQANAPTTQSPSLMGRQNQPGFQSPPAMGPSTQQNQQKLVLPPIADSTYNQGYATQGAYDATMRQPGPPNTAVRNAYPGNVSQAGGNYTPVRNSYAGYQRGSGQYQDYQQYPGQPTPVRHSTKGRTTALVLILLGLLFILIALVLFILQHNGTLASGSNATGSSITTTAPVTQRARILIQRYYDNINKRVYRNAYLLWKPGSNKQSFAAFRDGFQNTLNDRLTINDVAEQSDGTVKVSVTVDATETTANASTKYSTYQGYYIVEPQSNGSVEIIDGVLSTA